MSEFELDKEISKIIVDGTLRGYLQYLEERKEKKDTMNVSGAYAWTKGNHIDDQVSKLGEEKGVTFKVDKAGYTWEYLQFSVSENSEEYMVIVKNSRRVKKTFEDKKKKANDDNYLVELAEYNTHLFDGKQRNYKEQPEQIQLELSDPHEVKAVIDGTSLKVNQKYSRFYIVTYEIDDETKIITSIRLTMPNRETMNLELIEDLSYLIEESEFEITADDVEPILSESASDQTIFSGDSDSFGYAIPEEEKEANS